MVRFLSDEPIVETSSEEVRAEEDKVDHDAPQEPDEEKENPKEESIEKTPELCDDVVAQEPQVKESDQSRPIVSSSSASSSAINETELKKTDEASKKMDPSSSRKGKEICEIKTGDKEDDHNDDDDSKDCEFPYPVYEKVEYEDETSSVITQPEETFSSLPPYQNPNRSSEMFQVMVLPQENLGLGSLDPQSSYQISRIARMVNQQQQFIIPNQPFGMQLPLSTMIRPFMPYGFIPMAGPWRPPIIRPFMPNQTIIPQGSRYIYPMMQAPMMPMMLAPMMQAPMMPMMHQHVQMRPGANQQDEIAPNLLMRPGTNQQNQIFPYLAPGQAPMMYQHVQMRPGANQQEEIAPNLLMRPGTNQQNQINPYLAPGQAPMMPMRYQHVQMRPGANQQDEIAPNLLMSTGTNQQNQIVPYLAPGQAQWFGQIYYPFGLPASHPQTQSQGFNVGTSSERGRRGRRS